MKIKRLALVISFLLLGLAAFKYKNTIIFYTNGIHLASPYAAKTVCTCYFVHKKTREQCNESITRMPQKMLPVEIDKDKQHVSVSLLSVFELALAKFINDQEGCVLQ